MIIKIKIALQANQTPSKILSLNIVMKHVLTKIVLMALLCVTHLQAQNLEGKWSGILSIQKTKLTIVFNVRDTNTGYSATMDSPDQGAFGIPVTSTNFLNPQVVFFIQSANIVYKGDLSGDSIVGRFKQTGIELPLTLYRSKDAVESSNSRPQEPDLSHPEKLPYIQEAVTFSNTAANVQLSGTLTIPKKGNNFPAVILISGSGAQDRNEELMGHKPFMVIADYFSRNGIAVLRYDDRGYAFSTGDYDTSTIADFTEDARAALTYLKSRTDIKSVGLIGHSEGSAVAAKLAANNKDVAFIISLAGPGLRGDSLLLMQARSMLLSLNMTKEMGPALAQNRGLFRIINLNKSPKETEQLMREFLNTIPSPQPEGPTSKEEYIDNIVKMVNEPGLVYFIRHNPADDFSKVHCPVLALNGEKDFQVDAKVNIEAIAAALKIAGNKDVTTQIFPGKNHLFQACTTCTIQEYSVLEETFSEEVLGMMLEWMRDQ